MVAREDAADVVDEHLDDEAVMASEAWINEQERAFNDEIMKMYNADLREDRDSEYQNNEWDRDNDRYQRGNDRRGR